MGPAEPKALVPDAVITEGKSDRLAPAIWLGQRIKRFKPLVTHPRFADVYGRLIAGESPMRIAGWMQQVLPAEDEFGVANMKLEALARRLYRFKAALPPETFFVRSYLDQKFSSYESNIDVLTELDATIRLQKHRISSFAEKEQDFPVPLEQMRKEIETLGNLLTRRRDTAIALGLHPTSTQVVLGPQTNITQVNVSPAARQVHEVLQARPESVSDVTDLMAQLRDKLEVIDDDAAD